MLRPLRVSGARMCASHGVTIATALFALLVYPLVRPAYADVAVGGTSADFLGFEVGGRPAGMAGAQTASASGVTAQFWNPAGLTTLDRQQVGAMHATWLGDLSYEWLGYARPTGPSRGVTSVSIAYFHLPSISGVDEFDNPTGEFKVYDMAATVGYARALGKGLSIGTNAKMIRQNLATVSATGFAVDIGAMADLSGTSIGAVAQNLGPSLSFDGASYPLPRTVRMGASRTFYAGRVLASADFDMPSNYYNDVRIGTEFRAHPNVSLRLGYRHELGAVNDPATGFSFGLGLSLKQLSVDYAMTPSNDFDNVQRISFGYSFGSGPQEQEEKPTKPKEKESTPPPPAPTGPPVIASRPAPAPTASAPAKAPSKPQAQQQPPTPTSATPPAVAAAPAPSKSTTTESKPAAPAPTTYAVVLPGYQSKESAQAELKALALLGFRTKDAQISADEAHGGYIIVLQRTKSKGSADDLAADLSKMSFRATVQLVQR
jgi:hypothetical protein